MQKSEIVIQFEEKKRFTQIKFKKKSINILKEYA